MSYTSFDNYMKERFGGKVYRLSLSTGCTCPNRDGRCGTGGCIFCSTGGSGEFAAQVSASVYDHGSEEFAAQISASVYDHGSKEFAAQISASVYDHGSEEFAAQISASVYDQIEEAKTKVASKLSHSFVGYMAYFQSFTNTYFRSDEEFADVKARFLAAAHHPEILALAIATRPDALPQYIIDMLEELNRIKPVIVELGLQTIHNDTASLINRGYETDVYDKAVSDLHAAGIGVVTHMIIGLPGEDEEMMTATLRHIVNVSRQTCCVSNDIYTSMPDGIKLQLLHVLKGTRLADMIRDGEVELHEYSLEEYADLLKRLINIIPKEMVVHRLTGDPPKSLLISPLWTADKKRVMNTIHKYLD